MRFELTDDQRAFASSLDHLLGDAETAGVARAWADADTAPGLKLWARLAEQGVSSLAVKDSGASPVDLAVAFERLGWWAVPGPWVESAAYLPVALAADTSETIGTVAVPPHLPYALDADISQHVLLAREGKLYNARVGDAHRSVDGTRRLFDVSPDDQVGAGDLAAAFDLAVLAVSAQLLGCGERLLADTVEYAKQRRQFGREIGSYQAVKHALADVRIALDFARPLVLGAAVTGSCAPARALGSPQAHDPFARDVSAAKVAAGDAAYCASRVALQVHGAIGYTREYDLSLWITKVRALVGAWGTPSFHRHRILETL